MGKIIAIGGGEIGGGYKIETLAIDKEIVAQSHKQHPQVLFIPTASSDAPGYAQVFENYYGNKLGCRVDTLYLIKDAPDIKVIRERILSSNIIYVGGGNTLKLMTIWRKLGVDKILIKAYKDNTILAGLSAGSICWFKYGNSDSRKFTNNSDKLIKVKGLGLVNALHCPHYDTEALREKDLKRMMKATPGVAIALNNFTAIEIIDDEYRIIKSKSSAGAFRIYWKAGKYYKEKIAIAKEFRDLGELLQK